jgi:predicted ATP-binding protein involved in virulence
MTDEELKKKCKERAKIFQQAMESCHSSSPMDCIEWFADRIAELETQIEKMKCCFNCKHSRTEYEHCKTDKHEKWEIKEK